MVDDKRHRGDAGRDEEYFGTRELGLAIASASTAAFGAIAVYVACVLPSIEETSARREASFSRNVTQDAESEHTCPLEVLVETYAVAHEATLAAAPTTVEAPDATAGALVEASPAVAAATVVVDTLIDVGDKGLEAMDENVGASTELAEKRDGKAKDGDDEVQVVPTAHVTGGATERVVGSDVLDDLVHVTISRDTDTLLRVRIVDNRHSTKHARITVHLLEDVKEKKRRQAEREAIEEAARKKEEQQEKLEKWKEILERKIKEVGKGMIRVEGTGVERNEFIEKVIATQADKSRVKESVTDVDKDSDKAKENDDRWRSLRQGRPVEMAMKPMSGAGPSLIRSTVAADEEHTQRDRLAQNWREGQVDLGSEAEEPLREGEEGIGSSRTAAARSAVTNMFRRGRKPMKKRGGL